MSQLENPLLNIPFQKRRGGQGVNPGRQVAPNAPAQIAVTPDLSAVNELNQIAASFGALGGAVRAGIGLARAIKERSDELAEENKRTQEGQAEQMFREDAQRFVSQVEAGDIEFDLLSPEEQEAEADRLIADRTAGMNPTQAEYYRNRAKPWLMGQISEQVSVVRDAAVEGQRQSLVNRAFTIDSPDQWGEMRQEFAGDETEWLAGVVVPALEDAATIGDTQRFAWAAEQLGDRFPEARRLAEAVLERAKAEQQKAAIEQYSTAAQGIVFSDGAEAARQQVIADQNSGRISPDVAARVLGRVNELENNLDRQAGKRADDMFILGLIDLHNQYIEQKTPYAGPSEYTLPSGGKISRDRVTGLAAEQYIAQAIAEGQDRVEILNKVRDDYGAKHLPAYIGNRTKFLRENMANLVGGTTERVQALMPQYVAVYQEYFDAKARGMPGLADNIAGPMSPIFEVASLLAADPDLSTEQAILATVTADIRAGEDDDFAPSARAVEQALFRISDADEISNFFARWVGFIGGAKPDQEGDVGFEDIRNTSEVRMRIAQLATYYRAIGSGITEEDAISRAEETVSRAMIVFNGHASVVPPEHRPSTEMIKAMYDYGSGVANMLAPEGYDPRDISFRITPSGRYEMVHYSGTLDMGLPIGTYSESDMAGFLKDAEIRRQNEEAQANEDADNRFLNMGRDVVPGGSNLPDAMRRAFGRDTQ